MNYFDRCSSHEFQERVDHGDLSTEVVNFSQEFQKLRNITERKWTDALIQVLKGAFEQLNERGSQQSFSEFLDFYQKEVNQLGDFLDFFEKELEQKRQRKEMFLSVTRDTEKLSMNCW
jgi:hypothetical protein